MAGRLVLLLVGTLYVAPGILFVVFPRFRVWVFKVDKHLVVTGIAYLIGAILFIIEASLH